MRSFRREVFARPVLIFHTRASLIKSQCNEREERSECRTRASARERYMSSAGDSEALPFQVSLSVAWIRRSYF
jgi:hypothetical protein